MDLSLTPIVERIRDQAAAFKKVGLAADLAAARRELKQEPAAFVIPVLDRSGQNELANGVSQYVLQRFGVVIAVQNLRDQAAIAAQEELAPLRLALITALLGWAPDEERDPCTYGGGRLVGLTDRVLWWQDNFDTSYYVRAT
jgi:hypothetical protein